MRIHVFLRFFTSCGNGDVSFAVRNVRQLQMGGTFGRLLFREDIQRSLLDIEMCGAGFLRLVASVF